MSASKCKCAIDVEKTPPRIQGKIGKNKKLLKL